MIEALQYAALVVFELVAFAIGVLVCIAFIVKGQKDKK